MFIDTHCHIHETALYERELAQQSYQKARGENVAMLCIGTNVKSSLEAIEFVASREAMWAVVGVHPHDSKDGWSEIEQILKQRTDKLVGVGEIGLDYFYNNSPREVQLKAFEQQLSWAVDYKLPVSFHVREAFDDFWPIFDSFNGITGVLHSFTDSPANLEKALARGLYIGVNGISTFSKTNQAMWDAIPLEKMLLETDAPFLTPRPHRGKVNEPAFVKHVAEYHAERRRVELEHLARVTSTNATKLFSL